MIAGVKGVWRRGATMERCCGQAAMVHADHVNSWWGVELLIPLLKHTKYYYFCVKSMCRPMPTRGKCPSPNNMCFFFLFAISLVMSRFLQPSEKLVGNHLKSQCLDWLKKHLSQGQNQHVLAVWQRQQWRSSSGSLGSRGRPFGGQR